MFSLVFLIVPKKGNVKAADFIFGNMTGLFYERFADGSYNMFGMTMRREDGLRSSSALLFCELC